jgi:beta-phosphoglucomutase
MDGEESCKPEGLRAGCEQQLAFEAILFDFNGVIVDDEPLHALAFAQALQAEGHQVSERAYFERFLGLNDRELFEAYFAGPQGRTASGAMQPLGWWVEAKARRYMALFEKGVRLFDGAEDFIRAASARWPLAVVSGALQAEIEYALQRFGLRACFTCIVAAEQVQRGKPSPEGYLQARDALGVGACLVIEDAPKGIAAGKAAGMQVVALSHSCAPAALGEADLVLEGFAALRRHLGTFC